MKGNNFRVLQEMLSFVQQVLCTEMGAHVSVDFVLVLVKGLWNLGMWM